MPGSGYQPLNTSGQNSEAYQFRVAAKEGDILDELIGLTLLDTGFRAAEMAHMRKTWLKLRTDNPRVIVPYGEKCELGVGDRGNDGGVSQERFRGKPCSQCRNRADKSWAPDDADFTPKSENGANRSVPIEQDDTKRILRDYFKLNDTVVTAQTVTERVKRIGERADFDRTVTAHDIRDTFGTKLAKDGFGVHQIKNLLGHSGIEQAIDYIQLSGADLSDEFDDKWGGY